MKKVFCILLLGLTSCAVSWNVPSWVEKKCEQFCSDRDSAIAELSKKESWLGSEYYRCICEDGFATQIEPKYIFEKKNLQ